jgi:hypothetical protein
VLLEITGGVTRVVLMVMARLPAPLPPALLALKLAEKIPARVGVPESTPVVGLMTIPGGSPLAPKLVGLPLA